MFNNILSQVLRVRTIFIILGVVIVLEIIFSIRMLTSPISTKKVAKIAPISGGQIILTTAQRNYALGETVPVTIRVSTGGHITDGTDVVLKYDPKILEAPKDNFFTKGTIYGDYPPINIDRAKGIVRLSGITILSKSGFNGVGVLGILNFKASAPGKVNLSLESKKGSTTDSNIIEGKTAQDILSQVDDRQVTVVASKTDNKPTSDNQKSSVCASFMQACTNGDGKTGSQICRMGEIKDNICGFSPQFTMTCTACN